jgi:hypothetical protein
VADVDVRPLREPALERRLIAVARASAMGRPVVGTVLEALVEAAKHTLTSQKRQFARPSAL